jgi:uncharacterized protein YggE
MNNLLNDTRFISFARAALIVLMVYLGVLALSTLKGIKYIGAGVPATNTISVSGEGEVFAVPDTAQFTATVMETGSDVKTAQDKAAQKANDIMSYLKGAGIAEKDIQTADYSVSPQYEYQQATGAACRDGYCPPGRQVLKGYQVSETLSVKVRDTKKAGDLLSGVGSRGASSVSGLNFTVADEDALKAQARDKAIADARAKAQQLAGSLRVSLVRIVGFSENGALPPVPYAAKTMSLAAQDAGGAVAPEIATGQNKITSTVSLSYEIE